MLSVATNLLAINTSRQLRVTETSLNRSSMRLSSGLRINSAADDAAGLAISERMRAQIRGLRKADGNIRDGINLIQTADGGMNEISGMLIRQRELIIQGLNDTNTDEDRAKIQTELKQLTDEIGSISERVEFNTINLLGVVGKGGALSIANVYQNNPGLNPLNPDGSISLWATDDAGSRVLLGNSTISITLETDQGTKSFDWMAYDFSPSPVYWPPNIISGTEFSGNILCAEYAVPFDDRNFNFGLNQNVYVKQDPDGTEYYEILFWFSSYTGHPDAPTVNSINFSIFGESWEYTNTGGPGFGSIPPAFHTVRVDAKPGGPLWIQSGANEMQGMYIDRYDCRPGSLGIQNLSLGSTAAGNNSLRAVDAAIDKVTDYRATCGAQQNRLEHAMNAANISADNTEDAMSRISDADMAKEVMARTRATVLMQAGMSMLTQARQQPEMVLQLLR